jgi:hypothetical protein
MNVMTARQIEVAPGASAATRNPVAMWLLVFLTLGFGSIVWIYVVNRELRDYLRAVGGSYHGSPAVAAVLAGLWPIAFVLGLIPVWTTSSRVKGVQERTGTEQARVRPVVAVLLFFVLFANVWYVQRGINYAWLAAERQRGRS